MALYYDAVVLGGGLNGALSALGLKNIGMSVAIIELNDRVLDKIDDRVFAISRGSKNILSGLGVWDDKCDSSPMDDIIIRDEKSGSIVHYSHKMVGNSPMGYIVEGKSISSLIKKSISKAVDIYTSTSYELLGMEGGFYRLHLGNENGILTRLLICAEGKNSKFRESAGIKTHRLNYGQSCLVFNIKHERNHNNTAIEYFFPGGPLAVLPMEGGHSSSIVWTEKTMVANMMLKLPVRDLEFELERRLFKYLGKIALNTKISHYEISMVVSEKQYIKRVLLVGDAFHSIHPIAGQGFNVGIRDIAAMVEVLSKYHSLGSDIGNDFILEEIEARRLPDSFIMSAITTIINQTFSNRSTVMKFARGLAMSLVDSSPFLKNKMITHAMGLSSICR